MAYFVICTYCKSLQMICKIMDRCAVKFTVEVNFRDPRLTERKLSEQNLSSLSCMTCLLVSAVLATKFHAFYTFEYRYQLSVITHYV